MSRITPRRNWAGLGFYSLLVAAVVVSLSVTGCGGNFPWGKRSAVPDWQQDPTLQMTQASELADPSSADSAHGRAGMADFQSVLDEARNTNKLVMLEFVGSDWCKPCQRLQAEVFETPDFQQWARDRFIIYRCDFPKRNPLPVEVAQANESIKLSYESYVKGFPTVLILDGQGQVLGKMGYNPGGARAWIAGLDAQLQRTYR